MSTDLRLDDDLIRQVQALGKFKFKCEAVNAALREYVQRHGQASLLELAGKIDYYPDHDYKKLRARRKCVP
jgi:Arc/MetJ family transcription regulator